MDRAEERALRIDSILRTLEGYGKCGYDAMVKALMRAYGCTERAATDYVMAATAAHGWAKSKGGVLELTPAGLNRLAELAAVQTRLEITEASP